MQADIFKIEGIARMKHNVERLMEAKRKDCVGCHACFTICPVHAISMAEDAEGFLYPSVDEEKCIDCGACLKVCQISNGSQAKHRIPTEAYACMNQNPSERLDSSSGGIFIVLAKHVISQGGYVFGAAFDEAMHLRHTYTGEMEGLRQFMGSKYLQSTIGNTYAEARRFLHQGKPVLFSGTPCQIHGLQLFLGKEYENLITVDLACHGVPSPAVFRKYLGDLERVHHSPVVAFNFRAKHTGWKDFSSAGTFQNGEASSLRHGDCPYMKGFLSNLYLRDSCYRCVNKGENRYADVTLGDYWGVQGWDPAWDDDKGTSVVFARTEKGKDLLQAVGGDVKIEPTDKAYAESCNTAIMAPVAMPAGRRGFFEKFAAAQDESIPLEKMIKPYLPKKSLYMKIKGLVPKPIKNKIKKILKPGGVDTSVGWKNYAVTAAFANGDFYFMPHGEDPYMKGFLSDLYLRPSCGHCSNKEGNRFSDLTLADYWGAAGKEPDMDDNQGTSVVLVHTEKGRKLLALVGDSLRMRETDLAYVIRCNPSIARPSPAHPGRERFFGEVFGE